MTNKKFPGNPTRSYRSVEPLRVVDEVTDWDRLTPEELQGWRDRLISKHPRERGEILNELSGAANTAPSSSQRSA